MLPHPAMPLGTGNSAVVIRPPETVKNQPSTHESSADTLSGSLSVSSADIAPASTSESSKQSPELFKSDEVQSLSPKLAWLQNHGVKTRYYQARSARYTIGRFSAPSEEEVIAKYARHHKLKLWNCMADFQMYRFTVENITTKEVVAFLGDGQCLEEAFKDGIKNHQNQLGEVDWKKAKVSDVPAFE